MPYFERKDPGDFAQSDGEYEEYEDSYDDGFDDLLEDPQGADAPLDPEEERILAEEKKQSRLRKFQIAAGLGDFSAVLIGAGVILLLIAFLISMLRFVSSDFARTFSLWQIKF